MRFERNALLIRAHEPHRVELKLLSAQSGLHSAERGKPQPHRVERRLLSAQSVLHSTGWGTQRGTSEQGALVGVDDSRLGGRRQRAAHLPAG